MYASRHMVSVEENILYINSYILTNISYADFPKLVNKSQKRCMRSVRKNMHTHLTIIIIIHHFRYFRFSLTLTLAVLCPQAPCINSEIKHSENQYAAHGCV